METSGLIDSTTHDSNDKHDIDILVHTLKESRLKYGKNLIIAHVNVNSLGEKCDYFKDLLSKNYVDILCITESKLSDKYVNNDFSFDGYKLYRKDRLGNSGGLLAWIRADIPHFRDINLELDNVNDHIESMVFNLTVKREQWYLLLTYKNPKVSNQLFVDMLSSFYNSLLTGGKAKEIVMLGDVNINLLNIPNCLNDMFDVYGLTNLIHSPTCYKSLNGTLIDPVVVVNSNRFYAPINVQCGMSDWHNLVGCITRLSIPRAPPKTIVYRSYKHFDQNAFVKDISCAPFHVTEVLDDVDDKYWFMSNLYKDIVNQHAPMKKRVLKSQNVPYMNSGLRKQMYRRNAARNKYLKSRTTNNWSTYAAERNKATAMRRESIRKYFESKCTSMTCPNDFWKCVKPFLSTSSKNQNKIILNEEGHVITDTKDVCNLLNDFFATLTSDIGPDDRIITVDDCDWLKNTLVKHASHPSIRAIHENNDISSAFKFSEVSCETVRRKLQNIKPNKSTGYDNIPPRLAKCSSREIAETLTQVINTSFNQGIFPTDLKCAEVSPIHKKDNDMLKKNYRPISILTIFDKVFESIITDQITEFFKPIFNKMMCAYRKQYSSCHALTYLLDSWKSALDNNKCVGTLLMDLSKAYDCVPHSLLLCKLHAYGFTEDACRFIGSYLVDRKQRVRIDDKRSSWSTLSKGIPQGSGLGPVIFNIFMNDIFHHIDRCLLVNYADDNTLSACEESFDLVTVALQSDAQNAITWFKTNFMMVNPDKFQVMFIKSIYNKEDEVPETIAINGNILKNEDHVKLLGITIDAKLSFDLHINNICRRASQQLNILRRFSRSFQLKEMTMVYNAFIMSNFNYCPLVWHFCSPVNIRKMEKIQERALRLMHNNLTASYEELLEMSRQSTLHIKRIRLMALEVFKSIHNLNPAFMNTLFECKTLMHDLRDTHKLVIPSFKTIRYGKNTFYYHGAHIWNLLPATFKQCVDIKCFKNMLNSWDGPSCQCSACCF